MVNNKNKYVGYIRVSTDKQYNSGLSLDSQEDKIKKYVDLHDGELVKIYIEKASGKNINRKELNKILNSFNTFDSLIVYAIDRLSRSVLDTLSIINNLNKNGKNFISIRENLDTTTEYGKFTMTIISAFSEMERKIIRSRIKEAKKQAFINKRIYGKTPYGYKRSGNNLIVDDKEIKNIYKIFNMRKEKVSLNNIANYLNSNNIKSKNGGRWYASSIRSAMLTFNKLNPDFEVKYNKRKRKYKATKIPKIKDA